MPYTCNLTVEAHVHLLCLVQAKIYPCLKIGGVVKRDSRNLDVFEENQGNENLTKVLLWVEGNFSAAATGNVPPVWPASPTWSEAAGRHCLHC